MIITNETDMPNFQRTLGDGSQFGLNIQYDIQRVQRGISDAFIIGERFIGSDEVCLVLGDNVFYSPDIGETILEAPLSDKGAVVFGIPVPDPERFGVVAFDNDMKVTSLEEKPKHPKSNYAVVGLYFYDSKAPALAKQLKPSARGELEITDLNLMYLERGELNVRLFSDDVQWIDAGTFDSLLQSSQFVAETEKRLGKKILCPEIIAYEKGFVTKDQMLDWISKNKDNEYFSAVKKFITG